MAAAALKSFLNQTMEHAKTVASAGWGWLNATAKTADVDVMFLAFVAVFAIIGFLHLLSTLVRYLTNTSELDSNMKKINRGVDNIAAATLDTRGAIDDGFAETNHTLAELHHSSAEQIEHLRTISQQLARLNDTLVQRNVRPNLFSE